MLFIGHDLGIAHYICNEAALVYRDLGCRAVFAAGFSGNPVHDETLTLMNVMPGSELSLFSFRGAVRS